MAEALDILFDLCSFLETSTGFEAEDHLRSDKLIERINLSLLSLGKFTDLAADWASAPPRPFGECLQAPERDAALSLRLASV